MAGGLSGDNPTFLHVGEDQRPAGTVPLACPQAVVLRVPYTSYGLSCFFAVRGFGEGWGGERLLNACAAPPAPLGLMAVGTLCASAPRHQPLLVLVDTFC